jgi:symplekin
MTDTFKTDVLAAFMQQVMDQPVQPVLYLRTVIQIVTMYKPLQPYVSTTLLNRLITKKVWTNPAQWEGFMRLAKATEPTCYDALLQMPKEPLQQLLAKQPSLHEPLREHALQRASAYSYLSFAKRLRTGHSNNKNRLNALLEAIG